MVKNTDIPFTLSLGPSWQNTAMTVVEICFEGNIDILHAMEKLDALCVDMSSTSRPPVAVIRLRSTGTTSLFGGELSIHDINRWERVVRRFERLDATSVIVCSGVCGGIALDLMLASDYRMAGVDFHLFLPVHDGQFWPGMALYDSLSM